MKGLRMTPEEFERASKRAAAAANTASKVPTAKARMQALGRLKTGEMNKTEAEYAQLLEHKKMTLEIAWYKFEGMKFRLADNTFYTPDFIVMLSTGEIEAHEVKGFWTDDARVKIKIAADMYPVAFKAVTKAAKKDGGGWKVEAF